MVMAGGHPVNVYGLFTLPVLMPRSKALASGAHLVHTGTLPWLIVALVALHAVGALYHLFVRRDGITQRMLPGTAGPIKPSQ